MVEGIGIRCDTGAFLGLGGKELLWIIYMM